MKYIKKYESFRNINSETINEEFLGLGKLFGGLKELFNKAKERMNKTKGGKEVEVIYQKYLTKIHDELAKTAQIDLNVAAASKGEEVKPKIPAAATKPTTPGATASESINYSNYEKIFEADNAQIAVEALKKKRTVMDQIVQKLKAMALKEMDAVLTKFGGATGNPQLNIIIQGKKDQFEMDYLTSQIAYLDAAGDKTMIAEITKKRDIVAKKIENEMKDFDAAKVIKYEVGDEVIYLLKDKTPEMYDKNKKPEDQRAIVGVHKITEIDGDNFTLEDDKGEPTIKKLGKDLMGKVKGAESEDYKVGDSVIYLKDNKKKEDFDALSDEEKKTPTDEVGDKIFGIKKIEKIEGDNYTFKDSEDQPFTKTKDEIIGKSEGGEPVEGQEDLIKKLGDMKATNPEDIKKVSNYTDFINKPENAAKAAEIEKIIGEGGEQ
jgi:hypothetical protein